MRIQISFKFNDILHLIRNQLKNLKFYIRMSPVIIDIIS